MIYEKEPVDFKPKFEIVSCFVELEDKILLLHRQDSKPQGDTWGVPAGKMDVGEGRIGAMLRELEEETGIEVNKSALVFIKTVYVRYAEYDFIYHMFHTRLERRTDLLISPEEHKDFAWVKPVEAVEMPLIQDLDWCISHFYGASR